MPGHGYRRHGVMAAALRRFGRAWRLAQLANLKRSGARPAGGNCKLNARENRNQQTWRARLGAFIMAVSPDGVADASPGAKTDSARVGALSRRAQYCHPVRRATETSTTRARRWCRLFGCCVSTARVYPVPSGAETEDPAPGRAAVDAPPLTFKDFIRPAAHVEQLARALGAEVVPTVGQETAQSGPHVPTEAAPVAVISCCGSFVHRMREWGYTPLAAPILDFSSLRGTPVTPSDACRSLPRSFSIFVAPDRPDCRVRRIHLWCTCRPQYLHV